MPTYDSDRRRIVGRLDGGVLDCEICGAAIAVTTLEAIELCIACADDLDRELNRGTRAGAEVKTQGG